MRGDRFGWGGGVGGLGVGLVRSGVLGVLGVRGVGGGVAVGREVFVQVRDLWAFRDRLMA